MWLSVGKSEVDIAESKQTLTQSFLYACVAAGKMTIPYLFSDCKAKTSIVAKSESFSHLKMFLFLSVSCCSSAFEKKN